MMRGLQFRLRRLLLLIYFKSICHPQAGYILVPVLLRLIEATPPQHLIQVGYTSCPPYIFFFFAARRKEIKDGIFL